MSFLSSLFGGANQAASAQTNAMLAGLGAANANANTANTDITQSTQQAVAPYNALQPTMAAGTGALGNALGLGGPAGNQSALAQLQTTPGYQFTLGQGNNAINAAAAANGTLNSGNQATALANYDSGLAQNTYSNYVNQLQPYLSGAQNVAGGISGAYQNKGNQQVGIQNNLTDAQLGLISGIGNAQANASLANQGLDMSLLGGAAKGLGSLFAASDERLKDDIEPVGELFDGTNVYRYRYKGDPETRIGVMAQEIQERDPQAVADLGGDFSGFLGVDYKRATDFAAELGGLLEAA